MFRYIIGMVIDKNHWDILAETTFNTNISIADIESNAADNIFISWPVIIDCIQQYVTLNSVSKALDFGCGVGLFSRKLNELGFSVTGVDSSISMIKRARQAHSDVAEFKVGDDDLVPSLGTFTVIASLMTLQFIKDVKKTIGKLATALDREGILIFSVFNRAYAKNATEAGLEFFGFSFEDNPTSGYPELVQNDKIPTYIRDADYYNKIAETYGLQPILESYPPFTEEFLRDYPHSVSTKDPEYMILGFKNYF